MRIRKKIFYSYGIVLILILAVAGINTFTRYVLFSDIKKTNIVAHEVNNINKLAVSVLQLLMPANDWLITGNPDEIKKYNQLYIETNNLLEQLIKENDKHSLIIQTLQNNIEKIDSLSKKIFQIQSNGIKTPAGSALMYEMDRVGNHTYDIIRQHNRVNREELQTIFQKSINNMQLANIVTFLTWCILIGIGALIVYYFNKDIQIPIQKLSTGFRGISHGRWSHVDLHGNDEISDLAREFNTMIERMSFSYEELENEVRSRTKELNDLNIRLENISRVDGLTGLFNHKYFFERYFHEYERVVRYERTLCVFMIDIDNFKIYNDTNGHLAGDKVIARVAKILTKTSRKSDLVGRYGGEEFVIVAPEMDKKEALLYGER